MGLASIFSKTLWPIWSRRYTEAYIGELLSARYDGFFFQPELVQINGTYLDPDKLHAARGSSIWEHLKQLAPGMVLAIIAPGGSGKTSLLNHVLHEYAQKRTDRQNIRTRVPFLIDSTSIQKLIAQNDRAPLDEVLSKHIFEDFQRISSKLTRIWCAAKVQRGECIILLDGLSELPEHVFRSAVTWINHHAKRESNNIFIVASRSFPTTGLEPARIVGIKPLTLEQSQAFIYEMLARQGRESESHSFWSRFVDSPYSRESMRTPLMLTLLVPFFFRTSLPHFPNRAELFNEAFSQFFSRWEVNDRPDYSSRQEARMVLASIAAFMMTQKVQEISTAEAISIAAGGVALVTDPAEVIERLLTTGLLIKRTVDRLAFIHIFWQEYLASVHWIASGLPKLTVEYFTDSWSREALLFYASQRDATEIVEAAFNTNNSQAFEFALHFAKEAPLLAPATQRKVKQFLSATRALADLKSSSIFELAQASSRIAWTIDDSAELPEEFQLAVPRLDRAAQRVAQAQSLINPLRQSEVLGQAISELESVTKTLTVGRFVLPIRELIEEWRQLVGVELQSLSAQLSILQELPNPFIFGNPVTVENAGVFTGRRDIVEQVEQNILNSAVPPTLLLHGPRRMGKSSILNQLPRLLGPDFASAVVDCQKAAVRESLRALLRAISLEMSKALRGRRLVVEPLAPGALDHSRFTAFDDWLQFVEMTMPPAMRVLLCFDEYESLANTERYPWLEEFLDTLRNLIQYRPRFVLLFTGVHTFAELGPMWTGRFVNARRVRVSFLTEEELRPMLTKPIPAFDLRWMPGALEQLVAATNGQPFLTQAVAFELVRLLNEQKRKVASVEDIEIVTTRALETGGEYFANVWSDAGPIGQQILRALALGEPPPVNEKAERWLREHDIITGGNRFAIPMVRRWVEENATERS